MAAVVEAEDLTKAFGELVAVNGLNLSVGQGECYAFVGLNGSGKSTTARLLLDFIRPTRGTSRLLGGSGGDPEVRRRVGYLPGDLNLPRAMTADDAFDFFGGLARTGTDDGRVELVERFGLDPSRPFRELSTGNRRKVGLVLAFMGDPELLVLDEPTSGLDPVLQEEFRDLLAERKARGATIWLTSHVMAEVERVADRVGLIRQGHLARELSMAELHAESAGEIHFGFGVGAEVPVDAFEGVPGVTDTKKVDAGLVVRVTGSVAPTLIRAGELGAERVETRRMALDDIFISLLGDHGGEP